MDSATPVVALGSAGQNAPAMSYVRTDVDQGVQLGLGHLFARGHRRVGIILGRTGRWAYRRLLAAIRATSAAYRVDPGGLMFEEGDYLAASGEAAASRILDCAGPPVSALFAANDLMALGAMRAVRARAAGHPGRDLHRGMDGIEAGRFTQPELTTVVKPAAAMGREAVKALMSEIKGAAPRVRRTLACTLRVGGTVRTLDDRPRDAASRPGELEDALARS